MKMMEGKAYMAFNEMVFGETGRHPTNTMQGCCKSIILSVLRNRLLVETSVCKIINC